MLDRATVLEALDKVQRGAVPHTLESRHLDFKTAGRSRDDTVKDLAEAAACFANARGGWVIVGVQDRVSGPEAFEGTELNSDRIARRIYELTNPPLTVEVQSNEAFGARLLFIRSPRSPEIHQVGGKATRRVDDSCLSMSASQIANQLAERRGDDWSEEDSGRDPSTVSATAMERARSLLAQSPDPQRRAYAAETDLGLLRILGVISPEGTLTRAGALLLAGADDGTAAEDVIVYQYRRTPAGEPTLVQHLERPLLPAVLRLFELVDARVDKTPVNLPQGQQVQLADLPDAVVREAVANAVVHRDYRRAGPVRVEHAPTRLVVASPGPLVEGVTLQNILTTSSRPRNPRLAAAVRILGLAEEAGVGVDRMYRDMVRVGHEPPSFHEDPEQFRITLIGGAPNAALTRYVAILPAAESDDADTMLVLFTLLTHQTVTAQRLAPLLQKDPDEVESVLRRVAAEPALMIEPSRQTARRRNPNYRLREDVVSALGTAVVYRRRTRDEYDRKIIDLLRETHQINARMVKITLDLSTKDASRVLGDLVDRGIVVKTSDAQRGPSVTYGPGVSFPAAPKRGSRRSK